MTGRRIAAVALAAAAAPLLASSPAAAGPDDIVPRGDAAYDLLALYAAQGKLPGVSRADLLRGDRLYTRAELAALFASLRDEGGAAFRALALEFGRASSGPAKASVGLQAKVRALAAPRGAGLTVRGVGAFPVGRDGVAVAMAGDWRREFGRAGAPAIETLYVRVPGRALDVEIGRRPLRWGPGLSGALMLGDEAPAVDRVAVSKRFALPGRIGRRIGPLFFEQFHGQFFEDDVPGVPPNARGTRRDLAGRRLATAGEAPWSLSYAEAFKATRLPDRHYVPFLPWYVYQHDWTSLNVGRWLGLPYSFKYDNSYWFNFAADLSVARRVDGRGGRAFLDWMLDDIKAPKGLGQGNDTPQRTGLLAGLYLPRLGRGERFSLRLEAATIDRGTYRSDARPMWWTRGDEALGFPAGPNAATYLARLDVRLSAADAVGAEWFRRRRRVNAPEASEPEADRLQLAAHHALDASRFVAGRLEIDWTTLPGRAASRRVRAEFSLGFGW